MQHNLNYAVKLKRQRQFEIAPCEELLLFAGDVVRVLREEFHEEYGGMMFTCRTRDGYEFDIDVDSVEVVGRYA